MIGRDQPTLFDSDKLAIVVSSKSDGNTKSNGPDDLAATATNIRSIAEQANIPYDSITTMNVGANQAAWDEIVELSRVPDHALVSLEDRVVADALVTTIPGASLLLPVADCNAVAIHDPVQNVLALVHLGWQSTDARLATKVVAYLQTKHGSSATDLRVYFSPAIKAQSYVFENPLQADRPDWQPFLYAAPGGTSIDLPAYNRQQFLDAGVQEDAIEMCPVDTATSSEYFSHYRSVRTGEPEGRFAVVAMIRRS